MREARPGLLLALLASCAAPQHGGPVALQEPAELHAAAEVSPCAGDGDCAVIGLRDVETAGCCQPPCARYVVTSARAAAVEAGFKARCAGSSSLSCPVYDCPAPPPQLVAVCIAGRCTQKGP